MLKEIEIGQVGREWLIENLQDGFSLAQSILRVQDVTQGTVVALLPSGTPPERVAEIHRGWGPGIGASSQLGSMIVEYLRLNLNTHCVVFEDCYSSPSSPWIETRPPRLPLFFHDKEVYFLIRTPETLSMDAETVGWEVQSNGAFYPKVGAFTLLPPGLLAQVTRQPVSAEAIGFMATHTYLVFVAAYDNQSYLIWRKNEQRDLQSESAMNP